MYICTKLIYMNMHSVNSSIVILQTEETIIIIHFVRFSDIVGLKIYLLPKTLIL